MILPKWHVKNRNVKKSDVALIQNSNAVHGEWKLGIVSETFPRKDDKIKKVNTSYKNFQTQENTHQYKGTKYTLIKQAVQRLF